MQDWRYFLKTINSNSKFRYAPTPSGYLHLGNGVNFVLNWLFAKSTYDCPILLRIDDLDKARKRPKYVEDCINTLNWLGLDWQEGPQTVEDFEKNWSQHLRLDNYTALLQKLKSRHVLFPCKKSRKELAKFQNYPRAFRKQNISFDYPKTAWRIIGDASNGIDDFIVRKKDTFPSYQLASVVDDLHFGITHIVRGSDLMESTTMQQFLAAKANENAFKKIQFFHHPLIQTFDGKKLSKSDGASALKSMYKDSPSFVFNTALGLLGIPEASLHNSIDLLKYFKNNI